MTTPVLPDDRRHLSVRLTVLQYAIETYFAKLEGTPLPTLTPAAPGAVPADEPAVTPVATPGAGRSGQVP